MKGTLKFRLQLLEMPGIALPVELQESSNSGQKIYSVLGFFFVEYIFCYNSFVKGWPPPVILGSVRTRGGGLSTCWGLEKHPPWKPYLCLWYRQSVEIYIQVLCFLFKKDDKVFWKDN